MPFSLVQLKQGWNFSKGSLLEKRRENKARNKDYKNKETEWRVRVKELAPGGVERAWGPDADVPSPAPTAPVVSPLMAFSTLHCCPKPALYLPLHPGCEPLKATVGSSLLCPHA